MRLIGLHLRLTHSLEDVALKAVRMKLPFFQFFFVKQDSGLIIQPTPEDLAVFVQLRTRHFKQLFVHASYWINLADARRNYHGILHYELVLARKTGCTHMVLHAGSAKGSHTKLEGIDSLARVLNEVLRAERTIKIVLENTAFGGLSVGGDFNDFALLLAKIDKPDNLLFCVDTAHAHSYGYDITTPAGQEAFITELDTTIGIERIALLHVNDTQEQRGSQQDRHTIPGTGVIGAEALSRFMHHPRMTHIPVIAELPVIAEHEEMAVIETIKSWCD